MKKFRLFRLILALATAAAGIYMIYANISVSGYNLLTMDSSAGYRAATTYRWSVLIFVLLLAADIAAAVFYRRSRQKKLACPSCGALRGENDKFCKMCGYAFQKRK